MNNKQQLHIGRRLGGSLILFVKVSSKLHGYVITYISNNVYCIVTIILYVFFKMTQ